MYEAFLQLVPILASLLILLQFLHDVSQKTENNKKILRPGVNFIKLTFILQNAKIFRALSMFDFIKTLSPNFHNIMPTNDSLFNAQFHNTNLAFQTPKWALCKDV